MKPTGIKFVLAAIVWLISGPVTGYSQTSQPTVKTIFDYKQELNLNDRQEQDIKTILTLTTVKNRISKQF